DGSRAGRRPRAHKAARPGAAARTTAVNLAGHGHATRPRPVSRPRPRQ
ncbi:hypothetical protein HMPREF0970_01711, partial [Schaalia odontolytica F0309]